MSSFATPEGLLQSFGYGRASQVPVVGVKPAAGANYSYAIDGRWTQRVLAMRAHFVAGSNAANRALTVQYLDGDGNIFDENGAGVFVVASTTVDVQWQIDRGEGEWSSSGSDFTTIWAPLSDVFLRPGWSIKLVVKNVDAADQLSAITLLVEQFETGPHEYPVGRAHHRSRQRHP